MQQCTNDFATSDFYLACFLRCEGYHLKDMKREGRRFVFVFEDRGERRQDLLAFYNNTNPVPPLTFINAIKEMKSLIHDAKRAE